MAFLLIIPMIALLIFAIICTKKQKNLRGFYKQLGLVSNVQLFFTGCFLAAGVLGVISLIIFLAAGIFRDSFANLIPPIVVLIISLVVGVLMFINAKKKLPPELQKHLLRDCIIIYLGLGFRIEFFVLGIFLHTWFAVNAPEEYVLNDGRTVYKYPMSKDAYDCHGCKVGTFTNDNQSIIMN